MSQKKKKRKFLFNRDGWGRGKGGKANTAERDEFRMPKDALSSTKRKPSRCGGKKGKVEKKEKKGRLPLVRGILLIGGGEEERDEVKNKLKGTVAKEEKDR